MQADKNEALKRLNAIEGHIGGTRQMVEADHYGVALLRQTFAVRRAIEQFEAVLLEQHMHHCVPEGIKEGREEAVINELVYLYHMAGNRS